MQGGGGYGVQRESDIRTSRDVRDIGSHLAPCSPRVDPIRTLKIGIGGSRDSPATPLPHHRTCGSASGGSVS